MTKHQLAAVGLLPLIERGAAAHYCTVDEVLSPRRTDSMVAARRTIAKQLRDVPYSMSLSEIGNVLGRDYSTVRSLLEIPRGQKITTLIVKARSALRCV